MEQFGVQGGGTVSGPRSSTPRIRGTAKMFRCFPNEWVDVALA